MRTAVVPLKKKSVRQNDVLESLVTHGLTWSQARVAYRAFSEIIGDAVVNAQKVTVGEVLTLKPVWKQPRAVAMNCKVGKGHKLEKGSKHIYLGVRLKYVVNVHKSFMDKRQLNWY